MASPPPLTEDLLRKALSAVVDPELGKDLVSLGMVKEASIDGGRPRLLIELAAQSRHLKSQLTDSIEQAIEACCQESGSAWQGVEIAFKESSPSDNERVKEEPSALPGVKHVIAVGAGKGGVGKSTVAVTLALALARSGARVGLLDGDIYGPSIPTMLGLDDSAPAVRGSNLLPFEVHGIKAISIGKLVDPDKPLIWRGPMAHGAFKQLALQTEWGALDYLIVDLPPGTGDIPLTLAQLLPLTGSVIVCTPQRVAQEDARRAARMFQQLGVEILGVVENMSSFTGKDGTEYDLFGKGGAEILAQTMGLPFLGNLPIHPTLRQNLDEGTPQRCWEDEQELGTALDGLASQLSNRISIAAMAAPTLEIR
ncbi:MAG: Mrp/NBP35 family ATP-binding protein [Phycisphaerales bacterium]|nr:Mrp/NBP35 family ATP-binding protein [Phycisphaerales bacterium]